ncbi:VTT domain-containing protein [Methylobrevis sp. L22]|uniref:Phospholipase D n=2 Tax=Methylobrevis albus TaxID=2793297 RepID=A0A931MXR7_9HYPH|nr:VTT domain-containing protein [Methylobrevis albus]
MAAGPDPEILPGDALGRAGASHPGVAAERAATAEQADAGRRAVADHAEAAGEPVLRPGHNVWRIETAARATLLADAANYYAALRQALLQATRTVIIVGWDIDSRTPLVGPDKRATDGLPETLGAFLQELVRQRPDLEIKLLLWDYSVFYSLEREFLPIQVLQRDTPAAIELCLDDVVPIGASHHQKLVVVDDAVAFCGGIDLTVRRWDNPAHSADNPLRVDPAGKPYPPFHDVQLMVDGDAARALGELARARWQTAADEEIRPPAEGVATPWPVGIEPDFRDIAIGIARTQPRHGDLERIAEIETLFLDMIASATRSIYIENQFLTSSTIAGAIAARLAAQPELEVLIVGPRTHQTWLEHMSMLAGRIRFRAIVESGLAEVEGGPAARVRLVYPHVGGEGEPAAVMVHAKVMIIDDRLFRTGSANLCNRSCGTDTECDVVIEARGDAERAGIAALRDRMIAEHCGVAPKVFAAALAEHDGSLLKAVDAVAQPGRGLAPIEDGSLSDGDIGHFLVAAADPERPPEFGEFFLDSSSGTPRPMRTSRIWQGILALALVAVFALAWRYTPLSRFADEAFIASVLPDPSSPWTPLAVIAVFVVAGLFAFPVTLLIGTTAALFGAWPGVGYAAAGALSSAVAGYLIGCVIGLDSIRATFGPRVNRIANGFAKRGIVAVTAVRLVPIAPFSVVNVMAGAMRIRPLDFVIGTLLGLAPGLALMSMLGERMAAMMADPSWTDIVGLLLLIAAWIGVSVALQWGVSRLRRAHDAAGDTAADAVAGRD